MTRAYKLANMSPDIVKRAALCADLDDAARIIQDAAGITTGDVAAMFFSGDEYSDWATRSPDQREIALREYIKFEQHYAE